MQTAFLPTVSPKLETETSHTGLPLLSAERNLEGNSSDLALTCILEWDELPSVFLSTDYENKPQVISLTLRTQFNCLNNSIACLFWLSLILCGIYQPFLAVSDNLEHLKWH